MNKKQRVRIALISIALGFSVISASWAGPIAQPSGSPGNHAIEVVNVILKGVTPQWRYPIVQFLDTPVTDGAAIGKLDFQLREATPLFFRMYLPEEQAEAVSRMRAENQAKEIGPYLGLAPNFLKQSSQSELTDEEKRSLARQVTVLKHIVGPYLTKADKNALLKQMDRMAQALGKSFDEGALIARRSVEHVQSPRNFTRNAKDSLLDLWAPLLPRKIKQVNWFQRNLQGKIPHEYVETLNPEFGNLKMTDRDFILAMASHLGFDGYPSLRQALFELGTRLDRVIDHKWYRLWEGNLKTVDPLTHSVQGFVAPHFYLHDHYFRTPQKTLGIFRQGQDQPIGLIQWVHVTHATAEQGIHMKWELKVTQLGKHGQIPLTPLLEADLIVKAAKKLKFKQSVHRVISATEEPVDTELVGRLPSNVKYVDPQTGFVEGTNQKVWFPFEISKTPTRRSGKPLVVLHFGQPIGIIEWAETGDIKTTVDIGLDLNVYQILRDGEIRDLTPLVSPAVEKVPFVTQRQL